MDRKSTLIAAGALAGTLVAGTATIALTGGALGDRDRGRSGSVANAAAPVLGDPSWPAGSLGLPDRNGNLTDPQPGYGMPSTRGAQQPPVARSSGSGGAESGVGRSWGDDDRYEHEDHDEHERSGWGEGDD